jgi:hypothetical protein
MTITIQSTDVQLQFVMSARPQRSQAAAAAATAPSSSKSQRKRDRIKRSLANELTRAQIALKQWAEFDERSNEWGHQRIYVDEPTRLKWNNLDLITGEHKIRRKTFMVPVTIKPSLSPAEFQVLGEIIVDVEFDTRTLPIRLAYDINACLYAGVARAPDVSDEQYARLKRLAEQANLKVNLDTITPDFMNNILCAGGDGDGDHRMPDAASSSSSSSSPSLDHAPSIACITPGCFEAMLWFTEQLFRLPVKPAIMTALIREVRDMAHMSSSTSVDIWQQCMQLYTTVQQDVATYLWYAGVRLPPEEDEEKEEEEEAKQQQLATEPTHKKHKKR